ncbi:hypothetical protein KJ951_01445 [Patescibacteria group bacterium]|nr:hypothetical protein [Patescibacteria group bacterium]MBU1703045.1 hypothetical protein [Patescibacteria group bacterium]MBU1953994.1 hypothetical protein [Patescibacteria group bacterium]
MARKAFSFRFATRHPYRRYGGAVLVMIFVLVFAGFLLLETLKMVGFISLGSATETGQTNASAFGGAVVLGDLAAERAAYNIEENEKDVFFSFDKTAAAFATPGQQDVSLLNFSVLSNVAAKLQRLDFSAGEITNPADLVSLQLYVDGRFVTEKAFYDGHAVFDNLNLRLYPEKEVVVAITGQLSADAKGGHMVQIGLVSEDNASVRNIASSPLCVGLDFPAWGPAVSVIGSNL